MSPPAPERHRVEALRLSEAPTDRAGSAASALGFLAVVLLPVGLAISLDRTQYDTWGGFVWGPVLLGCSYVLARWVARRTGDPRIVRFLMGAAFLKIIVGALVRFVVIYDVYDGLADAKRYDDAASELVGPFRQGIFEDLGKISGTRFIDILNGVVQAVIGETELGSFFVFSFFGFAGLCLLYVAFCEALPNGDRRLFRLLLFLTPSMWFWPSSVGKEAFLLLCIGAVAYGLARLGTGHFLGVMVGAFGLWGAIVVRPHMALLLLVGAAAALLPLGRSDAAPNGVRRGLALVLPIIAIAAVPLVSSSVETFFGLDKLDPESATDVREEVIRRSSQGGSEFAPPDASSPVGFVGAVATVTVRPFPWEARSATSAAASLESLVLLGIIAVAATRRWIGIVKALRERLPRFALGYVLAFAWAFSAVANFGILVRQRSLMIPFVFLVVASSTRTERRRYLQSDPGPPEQVTPDSPQTLNAHP